MQKSSGSKALPRDESSGNKIVKTVPVIRDLTLNPSCKHGPTILFERDGTRFFSCSAYRSRKLCEFFMPEEKWKSGHSNKCEGSREVDVNTTASKKRSLHSVDQSQAEQSSVKKSKNVEDNHPLAFPNQSDKGEAQYHFNTETVDFFLTQFRKLNFDSILCVGTPSLHKSISEGNKKTGFKSFLLDLDERFASIYKSKFARYNMCNHHFFETSKEFEKFLAQANNLAVIIDPPFGVKVELIWHGCVAGVKRDFFHLNESDTEKNLGHVNFFWIFPYFMEGHIIKCSEGTLRMSDFHVEYKNHAKFIDSGSKSKSSPVRIFTTVPLSHLEFDGANYRFCDTCSKWVDKHNLHCDMCETCTTKDGGGTYVHCFKCEKCVKPSWKHCWKCSVCHLPTNSCKNAKQSQRNDLDESSKKFNVDVIKSKKTKRGRQKDEDSSNIGFKRRKLNDKQNSKRNRKREQKARRNKKTARIK